MLHTSPRTSYLPTVLELTLVQCHLCVIFSIQNVQSIILDPRSPFSWGHVHKASMLTTPSNYICSILDV